MLFYMFLNWFDYSSVLLLVGCCCLFDLSMVIDVVVVLFFSISALSVKTFLLLLLYFLLNCITNIYGCLLDSAPFLQWFSKKCCCFVVFTRMVMEIRSGIDVCWQFRWKIRKGVNLIIKFCVFFSDTNTHTHTHWRRKKTQFSTENYLVDLFFFFLNVNRNLFTSIDFDLQLVSHGLLNCRWL